MQAERIDLERDILLGLAAEWEEAVARLSRAQRARLRRPQFALAESGGRLGVWDPGRGEIRVSRRFVLGRGWDEVRELLRHEAAHQVADEALGGRGETAHGPAFREACRLLGAHPGASGDFVPLAERIAGETDARQARVSARVRKLLALAASSNRHEAELALLRAREYARRHRVDAGAEGRAFVSVFAGVPGLRHGRDEYQLAALVSAAWEVYAIWVPAWVVGRGRMGTALELSGEPAQVRLAGYAHDFVRRHVATEWERYARDRRLGARRRLDFACGVIEGFRGKLERAGKSPSAGEAVVRTGRDPRLATYLAARYPRRTTIRRGGGRVDPRVHREGVRAGERLVLRAGIEGAPAARPGLAGLLGRGTSTRPG
ncbi:MAG TPA: DUF2786 domain-containing protein [Candidatus Methanoperedens sp.]|nr:DUF2786 domain-containing protein [Candidatus Methanoperedens sp.]